MLECRALLAAINPFPAHSTGALPAGIASGIVAAPGGDLWFTEPGVNKIGNMTTTGNANDYTIPTAASNPQGIAFGPDGKLWFTEAAANKIGVITTAGVFAPMSEFTIPLAASNPQGITTGPDGNLWFTEPATGVIGAISPSGTFLFQYPITTTGGQPSAITTGPDGNLWFTEPAANKIGMIVPSTGKVTEFSINTAGGHPQGITTGPDGNLWFTESGAAKVGKITTAGAVMEYAIPTPGGVTEGITAGSDGNLWFTEPGTNQVGRITPSGVVTEFASPTSAGQPWGITTGPDGNPWFTDPGANDVAQVALGQLIVATPAPATAQAGNPSNLVAATFTSAAVNPQTANFSATIDWGDGTSSPGFITAGASGVFMVSAIKTYSTAGIHQAHVTIRDNGGASATTNSTVNVAYPATGLVINAVEGQFFSGLVASFSDPQTTGQVGQYSANINWGDSTTSAGVVIYGGGTGFTVSGSHTYAEEGPYQVTITIGGPNSRTFLAMGQAVVKDAALHAAPAAFAATAGVPFTGVVATFSDDDPNGGNPPPTGTTPQTDYQATILWGDGHTSTGTIAAPTGAGFFTVTGTNTYATAGSYGFTVTILDTGGYQTSATGTVTVASSSSMAAGINITPTEGQPFSDTVATFLGDMTQTAGSYQATIDWGDGQSSSGSMNLTGTSGTVSGVHTYAEEGTFPVVTTITGPGAAKFIAVGQAVVKDALLSISPLSFRPVAGTLFTGIVATFTDADPLGQSSDYHAVITWGDGNFSDGQIVSNGNGGFDIVGSNTYTMLGKTYAVTVQVFDSGGSMGSTNASQAFVGGPLLPLMGHLVTASISGPDKSLNITNVNRPTFQGTAAAFAVVQLYAQQANTSPTTTVYLGQTLSGPDGSWSLTSPRLADGVYIVTASMTSQAGFPTAPLVIVNPLYIDTVGPRVSGMVFNPTTGIITVVISDAWSGLYQPSLLDPSNYTIMPRRNLIGSNSRQPSLNPAISGFYTNAQSATLMFKAPITAGKYLFQVRSGGVIDQAANPLDGEFDGQLPSGDGRPGGNFVAQLIVPKHLKPKTHAPRPSRFHAPRRR